MYQQYGIHKDLFPRHYKPKSVMELTDFLYSVFSDLSCWAEWKATLSVVNPSWPFAGKQWDPHAQTPFTPV